MDFFFFIILNKMSWISIYVLKNNLKSSKNFYMNIPVSDLKLLNVYDLDVCCFFGFKNCELITFSLIGYNDSDINSDYVLTILPNFSVSNYYGFLLFIVTFFYFYLSLKNFF